MTSIEPIKSIFMVEDDPDIQVIAQMSLEEIGGYDVEVFNSGAAFFDALQTRKPQLLLLDVMLPKMDGPTILKTLRQHPSGRHIPVIFMTAKIRPTDHIKYKELGVLGVIGKPFDPITMVQTIEDIWAQQSQLS